MTVTVVCNDKELMVDLRQPCFVADIISACGLDLNREPDSITLVNGRQAEFDDTVPADASVEFLSRHHPFIFEDKKRKPAPRSLDEEWDW